MYQRVLQSTIESQFGSGKAIVLIGPRQVGKTTLIEEILKDREFLFLDGDDPATRALLNQPNTEQIRSILGSYKLVFIDEAQRIEGIGLTMKIIVDRIKNVQILVSGSSSFDLSNTLNEPLTGRKWEYRLFPISFQEYEGKHGRLFTEQQLENRLLYGFYPDVLNHPGQEQGILSNLVNSYLYRDILSYSDIRKSDVLEKLVRALALQVGQEVNYTELAQLLNIDKNTVSKYIQILEQGFVIFRLGSFSRNLRNEIKTNMKVYFYDNGVRNTVIGNFNTLALRNDVGALWENFLISERKKCLEYSQSLAKTYFWRTKQQQEIDLVEEHSGKIWGYELKWNDRKKKKFPTTFSHTYKADCTVINRSNFREFVMLI